ncbi:hypothetical protein [Polaribacter sp. Hel1_85]|uniref:hypothetical protein n=1 Tax=Polaribacter sp. Hel1_85 TaxID=1250005 RepID=UPI00052CAC4F|nr:hypothetical protein [Polaribacter sp. Hel1_85]KGL62379.1 conserved hypothetical membrane protein [Polaribacter sp. Hel1_85]
MTTPTTKTDTTKPNPKLSSTKTTTAKVSPGISEDVISELSREINNMLSFAIFNGITVNTEVNSLIQNSNVDDLINAHNLLCKNVAPATPKSIGYTQKLNKDGDGKSIFRKLPLLRNLVLLALAFLVAYIATGMSSEVNNDSLDKGMMNNSGIPLLLNITYLSSVAGLGVLFFLLKEVSISLKKGSLIPENAIGYLSQIILGIISGLIMSEIISFYTTDPKQINLFNKSILALVGGFSSDAIFSILQGIINRIKSFFISPNAIN